MLEEVLLFWYHSEVKFLTSFWRLFWLYSYHSYSASVLLYFTFFVVWPYFNTISFDFYAVKYLIYIYFVDITCLLVAKCLSKRFECFKNFNLFFMYLFRWWEGGSLMHAYVLEHIVNLYCKISRWIFMELSRDEVLVVPHMSNGNSARSANGRIQGGATIGRRGPFFTELLLQTRKLQQ